MKRKRLFEPCGADEAPDEQRASSSSPSVRDAPWEAVPHEDNVYINVLVGGTAAWVVHRVMQIREPLPSEGKDWYLVPHEGWATAVGGSDSLAPLPLDDVFKGKKLWRAADGELFVENTRTKIVASFVRPAGTLRARRRRDHGRRDQAAVEAQLLRYRVVSPWRAG